MSVEHRSRITALKQAIFPELSQCIRDHVQEILRRWRVAAERAEGHPTSPHREDMLNEFSEYLRVLADALAGERREADSGVARRHGRQRWGLGWRIDAVVSDYRLLRVVLAEFVEERLQRRLAREEESALHLWLDDAVQEAVAAHAGHQARRLSETEALSRGTFENAAVGIAHLGFDACMLRANQRFRNASRYPFDELAGLDFTSLLDPADHDEFLRNLQSVRSGELGHFKCDLRLLRRDKSMFWAHITVSLQRENDRPAYFIAVVEDITKRQELAQALDLALAEAEEGNRLKSEFVANVSHEIRTPMTAILGLTDLALEEDLPHEVRDYLRTVRESAQTLSNLVDDLLDFSRIESGKLVLESAPFQLWELVDDTVKALSIRASEKGLELLVDIHADVPRRVTADRLRLRQIFTNLIGNALKFTAQGEVLVTVQVVEEGAEDWVIKVSVRDTGIGISAEQQQRIFSPFTQADASTTRVYGGSGLGLAICKELIAKFGGELTLDSELGRGSCFTFTARLAKALAAPQDRLDVNSLANRRVLIVDDSATNRSILVRSLKPFTGVCDAVANGQAAVRLWRQAVAGGAPYDVVLVDALMPGMDGFEVVEQISRESAVEAPTVLMLSSADRSTFYSRLENLEVSGFLDKPVSKAELLRVLRAAVAREEEPAERPEPPPSLVAPLQVLVVEDVPANQKVVRAILTKRGHSVESAHNGREAIEKMYVREFDVVLMDVQMPTVDGYQATAAIRAMEDERRAATPIIAMTAHAMRGDVEKCLAAGMNDYVAKPIDAQKLVARVEQLGGSKRPASLPPESTPPTTEKVRRLVAWAGPANGVINVAAALKRLNSSEEMLAELVQFYLEDAPPLLERIEACLTSDNRDAVRRAAHSLKGLAGNFDASQVVDAARIIEDNAFAASLEQLGLLAMELRRQHERLEMALKSLELKPAT